MTAERFFSIAQQELAVFAFMFESLDGEIHQIRTASIIDANVRNEDSNYDEKFWTVKTLIIQLQVHLLSLKQFLIHLS